MKPSCNLCEYDIYVCAISRNIRFMQMNRYKKNNKLIKLMAEQCGHYKCRFKENNPREVEKQGLEVTTKCKNF